MRKFSQRKKKLNLTHNKKNKTGVLIIICLGLVLFSFILLIVKSGFLNIKKTEISLGKNLDCVNEDQLKYASGVLGLNILFVNNLTPEKNIKEKFICVKNITFIKSFPDKIKIEVSGREPAAIVSGLKIKESTTSAYLENIATPSANLSSEAFLMDNNAVIFSKNIDNLNIPKIFIEGTDLSLGKKLEGNLMENCLKILDKIKQLGIDAKTTLVSGNSLIIFSSPKIIFNLADAVDTQIASLQLILGKAKIDSSQVEFIDLRFDKPVVRFAPKKN